MALAVESDPSPIRAARRSRSIIPTEGNLADDLRVRLKLEQSRDGGVFACPVMEHQAVALLHRILVETDVETPGDMPSSMRRGPGRCSNPWWEGSRALIRAAHRTLRAAPADHRAGWTLFIYSQTAWYSVVPESLRQGPPYAEPPLQEHPVVQNIKPSSQTQRTSTGPVIRSSNSVFVFGAVEDRWQF